jgi:hypothetical protein
MTDFSYTENTNTGSTMTVATSMGTISGDNPTAQGVAALQYIPTGTTTTTQLDSSARTTETVDAMGDTTTMTYSGTSLVPSSITLPTPNRNQHYEQFGQPAHVDRRPGQYGRPADSDHLHVGRSPQHGD